MKGNTAVVLMSGGIDSATCMGLAARQFDSIIPVHFQYGQQTEDVELDMAYNQVQHLSNVYDDTSVGGLQVVNYDGVFHHFAGGVAEPGKDFSHMEEDDGRSSGYVPMRNLHLIATGAAFADDRDAIAVFHGAQAGDDADYPDCRQTFMDSAAGAISKSVPDGQEINLQTPLIHKEKFEVIKLAHDVGVEFRHTYSCYTDVEDPDDPTPCGECPACAERAEAFEAAGIEDPFETPEVVN